MLNNSSHHTQSDKDNPHLTKSKTREANKAAAKRYRERNPEETRRRARERMQRVREQRKGTTEAGLLLEQRRAAESIQREGARQADFINKYGQGAFERHYLPKLDEEHQSLPRARWDWVVKADRARLRELNEIIYSGRGGRALLGDIGRAEMEKLRLCRGAPHLKAKKK
ncbi:hypothetical protein FB45DRAFT_907467 [Roridomyces roridus]|uniref:BZIP domain-containing protein n=1 Tax=Roridomyces roridus TaxID=1738132 RepID=A0AAD7B3G6_9AGAR|nr:hypothetical protein FB45DRAFT_944100 [Roridomyces roridus]KAJ7636842.1 hypothetical protein FB45DRAFT_907467 [Roridomyces roridus]